MGICSTEEMSSYCVLPCLIWLFLRLWPFAFSILKKSLYSLYSVFALRLFLRHGFLSMGICIYTLKKNL